jgi:hypothetical protein
MKSRESIWSLIARPKFMMIFAEQNTPSVTLQRVYEP